MIYQHILAALISLGLAAPLVARADFASEDTSVGQIVLGEELDPQLAETQTAALANLQLAFAGKRLDGFGAGRSGCRTFSGVASIYGNGDGFEGKKTATGGRMNPGAMAAAMKPPVALNSMVTVNCRGAAIPVLINDRGPYVAGRIIDLSPRAARACGIDGLGQVTVTACHLI